MAERDSYFNRLEVSNSDLSMFKKELYGDEGIEPIEAYRFGTLLDALITEQHKVNEFKRTVEGVDEPFTESDFENAKAMRKAFRNDPFCMSIMKQSEFQRVDVAYLNMEYSGIQFGFHARCKWDFWMNGVKYGADLKSTTAKTQSQFVDACYYFEYDRQRYGYMTIGQSSMDILIGISKSNHKIFKLPIKRNDPFFNSGKEKYEKLAFEYWKYFGEIA